MGAAEGPTVLHGREQAEPLEGLLRAAGFRSLHVPMIQLRDRLEPPPSRPPSALLVTSPATAQRCPALNDLGAPILAVGEATARALRGVGQEPRWVGAAGGAEAVALLQGLLARGELGAQPVVWAVGARALSAPLEAALGALSGASVLRWVVYENIAAEGVDAQLGAAPAWVGALFASGSAVEAYLRAGGPVRCPSAALVAIGRPTAAVITAAGLRCAAIADRPEPSAMVEALVRVCGGALRPGGTWPG
jgi:uroporphyrinogen-III synthase